MDRHRTPPVWLVSWRRIAAPLVKLVRYTADVHYLLLLLTKLKVPVAARAETIDVENLTSMLLLTAPARPEVNDIKKKADPKSCMHRTETGATSIRKSGNSFGKYGICSLCDRRWLWNNDKKVFEEAGMRGESLVRASSSQQSSGSSHSRAGARPKPMPRSSASASAAAPARATPTQTVFMSEKYLNKQFQNAMEDEAISEEDFDWTTEDL